MSNKLIIDAVITWVDSSNKIWRKKINKFLKKPINWEDKKSSTKASQLAYKVDRIVSGLHLTLNFEDEKIETLKIETSHDSRMAIN